MNQENQTIDWPEGWSEKRRCLLRDAMFRMEFTDEASFIAIALDIERNRASIDDILAYFQDVTARQNMIQKTGIEKRDWVNWYDELLDYVSPEGHEFYVVQFLRLVLLVVVGMVIWPFYRLVLWRKSLAIKSLRKGICPTFAEFHRRYGPMPVTYDVE